jgi:hypothetical protein
VNGGELAALVVLVLGAWRAVDLAVNPWRKCRWCGGDGKGRWSHGAVYGDCRFCDGGKKPRELRTGARFVRPGLARKVK